MIHLCSGSDCKLKLRENDLWQERKHVGLRFLFVALEANIYFINFVFLGYLIQESIIKELKVT